MICSARVFPAFWSDSLERDMISPHLTASVFFLPQRERERKTTRLAVMFTTVDDGWTDGRFYAVIIGGGFFLYMIYLCLGKRQSGDCVYSEGGRQFAPDYRKLETCVLFLHTPAGGRLFLFSLFVWCVCYIFIVLFFIMIRVRALRLGFHTRTYSAIYCRRPASS